VFVLVLGVTALRVLYIAFFCPYSLVEDESSYWEWSRHLDWSYYTKGPGIAWTIAAFTRVLGTTVFAIRLVPVLASAMGALCVAGLARDISTDKRAGFYAAACFLLAPVFQLIGLASTIDGPYAACWAAAAWAAWRALERRSLSAWVMLGVMLGVGTLYKYTMMLLIPGIAAFAFCATPSSKPQGSAPKVGPVLALVLFLILTSPIAIWNSHENWPTLRHLLGHLHVSGGDKPVSQGVGGWHYNPGWTLGYIGTQMLIAGPMLILAVGESLRTWKARREDPDSWRAAAYLLSCGLPILIFYLIISFITNPQGNWALAGFVTIAALAGWRCVEGMAAGRRATFQAWRATLIIGLITGLGMLRLDLFSSLPLVGKYVPVWRFTGAERMGNHADRLVSDLRSETGQEPFIMAQHYGRASQLAFYMQDRPTAYCTSSLMLDGRLTPYDYWPETNLRRQPQLVGRPALVVGNTLEDWTPLFDRVEEIGSLEGDGKKTRPAFKGYNFHGFPKGGLRSPGAPELPEP
jgi:undecaprenyl-diphosphatase